MSPAVIHSGASIRWNRPARTVVINLARREDRWRRVRQMTAAGDWPWAVPERLKAIDGQFCRPPSWWRQGRAAWGCYRSHMMLLETAVNDRLDSLLVLEDDAVWLSPPHTQVQAFFESLPERWFDDSLIYLGGQHLKVPRQINDLVYRPSNVNRTHAMFICGRMLSRLYRELSDSSKWRDGEHIDHRLGRLHETDGFPVFGPVTWFFAQAEGYSNIAHAQFTQRCWQWSHATDRRESDVPDGSSSA